MRGFSDVGRYWWTSLRERKFHRRKSPRNNRHYHKLNVRQNYPRQHMLASRFRTACFSAISRKFSYTCTLHVVLSDAAALLHFPVSVRSRFTRTDGDIDGDADGAGRGFLSQKFWVLNAPRIFRGRKALMDHIPGRSCTNVAMCDLGQRGWMFNWAFGRARSNANVSHNPACQLTLLETSSAPAHTADSDKSGNWLWIDVHVRQSISKGPRKIGGLRLRWQIAVSECDKNY